MTRPRTPGIGDRELELLHWVARQGEISVGEAAAGWGGEQGLARSTVQTMLERLHDKGHLHRQRRRGVYRYTSRLPAQELMRGLVRSFVEGPLAGSVTPFVAYLTERREVSEEELRELQELVDRLRVREEES